MSPPAALLLLQAPPETSPLTPFVPIAAVVLIFYFLVFRPQQKRQREQETMLKNIEKGDGVVTAGGIHGKVTGLTDDVLTIEVASVKGERVRIKVARPKIDSVEKAKKGGDG